MNLISCAEINKHYLLWKPKKVTDTEQKNWSDTNPMRRKRTASFGQTWQTAATYWGGWWHRAVWPPGLQWSGHLRRAGPQDCRTACCRGCRRHIRAQSGCWCCSGWGSRCLRSPQAGNTCSSLCGWSLLFLSGCWQCCLWREPAEESAAETSADEKVKHRQRHFTFPVHNSEVGVGGTDSEDKLVANERLVCVHCAYCLNQLQTREKLQQHFSFFKDQDRHIACVFYWFPFFFSSGK